VPWFAIADSGPGIAPGVLSRLFTPFFTTKRQGTGLGLAIVHRIVDAHAGMLDVDTALGRGTTFRVRLPAPAASGVATVVPG
jgi:signal transduction histidine kinase